MAVSFVMKSGLARIVQPLDDALDRGAHVRILTTDYLAITDPDALTQLTDLADGRRPATGGPPVPRRIGCVPPEGLHLLVERR